ncbi:hypothetical protein NI821_20145, partial [Escherichia coli]|uniref:hypothetical protein n=1 Tax=Escherichia coli TaxID=562 RepID=UPI00209B0FC3
ILLRQKQKKLIMLPSETMIWQPEFTDKTLSRKPGAVQTALLAIQKVRYSMNAFRVLLLSQTDTFCAFTSPNNDAVNNKKPLKTYT